MDYECFVRGFGYLKIFIRDAKKSLCTVVGAHLSSSRSKSRVWFSSTETTFSYTPRHATARHGTKANRRQQRCEAETKQSATSKKLGVTTGRKGSNKSNSSRKRMPPVRHNLYVQQLAATGNPNLTPAWQINN